jgi:DNA-binding transcriptional MerR regulator
MPYKRLSTTKIAKAVGCHPNTVRLYEGWGFLPPIPRAPNGYRMYTEDHLEQMRLARTALNTPWPGKAIRQAAVELVLHAASGDLGGALEKTYHYMAMVQAERSQAELAADLVARWAQGIPADSTRRGLRIRDAALHLNVSVDQLRNWERNGLLVVPRSPANGYRLYSAVDIARARIIRVLRNAGYSLMAILRMLTQLSVDDSTDIKQALDTPRTDEDVLYATDQWLTTLKEMETRGQQMIAILEERLSKNMPI